MGILKNFDGDGHEIQQVDPISNIDPLVNTNQFGDSSSSSDDEEVHENASAATVPTPQLVPLTTTRTPKVKKPVSNIPKPTLHVKNKKSQGHRHARRHENMCFLLNMATDLEDDFAEVNMNDLVETTVSAFAELLLSKNKMKIWNEFIELPEHQQEHIVKIAIEKKKSKKKKNRRERMNDSVTTNSCSSDENIETFVLIENRPMTANDHTSIDPLRRQEEAETCFRRIDSNIRYTLKSMLRRHNLPLERISWLEDDLIPYFQEHPDSVYLRDFNHGFDRMLLHAVCQYLNLISKSFTRDGERYTQVENRRVKFVPPMTLLSEYLMLLDGTMKH